MTASSNDRLLAPVSCPQCQDQRQVSVLLMADTASKAARRPVTPELVHICPQCSSLLVLSLHPAPQQAITR
jgi:hypothetical protein